MMWVLIGLSMIEIATVHFLLSFWNGWVALTASLLTGATIIWLVHLLRSMRRLPVLLDDDVLVMRVGTLSRFDIDRANIAAVRQTWASGAERAKSVANLALIAYPNIMIDLTEPVMRKRLGRNIAISSIAHRLDDLQAFLIAIKEERSA